jgi:hypothetical protein
MTLSALAAIPPSLPGLVAGERLPAGPSLQAGYAVSLTDLAAFEQALTQAATRLEARGPAPVSAGVQALFAPLQHLDAEAASLSSHARAAMQAGQSLTPGEMVMLSVRCHEFLFHSQLTANVANRTSDGLQQLFRQQA